MKISIVIVLYFLIIDVANCQSLKLNDCQRAAINNSTLLTQQSLLDDIAQLETEILDRNLLPKLSLSSQYTYYSDVVQFPGTEAFGIGQIPKNQYVSSLTLSQTIYDGGLVKYSKIISEKNANGQQKQLEVDELRIKQSINEIFFGALIFQENELLLKSIASEIRDQLQTVQSLIKNGVVLKSSENNLRKELLSIEQQRVEAQLGYRSMIAMLEKWMAIALPESIKLSIPDTPLNFDLAINRPELKYFDITLQLLKSTAKLTKTKKRPQIGGFVDYGMGKPNPFNLFDTDLNDFYMAGIKLNWQLWDWNQTSRERQILEMRQKTNQSQKTDFEKEIDIALKKLKSDISKYQEIIELDQGILALQKNVVQESYAQFKNGVITSTDYVGELNEEIRISLTLKIHEIQYHKAIIDYLTTSGNY